MVAFVWKQPLPPPPVTQIAIKNVFYISICWLVRSSNFHTIFKHNIYIMRNNCADAIAIKRENCLGYSLITWFGCVSPAPPPHMTFGNDFHILHLPHAIRHCWLEHFNLARRASNKCYVKWTFHAHQSSNALSRPPCVCVCVALMSICARWNGVTTI